jgi:hypothetical protein
MPLRDSNPKSFVLEEEATAPAKNCISSDQKIKVF